MLFLPPSRNLAFGVKTFSFFSSPEDNASVCHSEVPIDPFGRMLESSYSSPRAFVNTEGRWLHTAAESSPEFGIFAHYGIFNYCIDQVFFSLRRLTRP